MAVMVMPLQIFVFQETLEEGTRSWGVMVERVEVRIVMSVRGMIIIIMIVMIDMILILFRMIVMYLVISSVIYLDNDHDQHN